MSHLVAGLSLALAASLALNASYLIQHAGSAREPTIALRRPLGTLRSLLSSRLWLGGGVLGLAGWALSIAALTQAPLSLVQAFLIAGIALVAPIAVRMLGHQLTAREVAGVVLVMIALLALLAGRGHIGIHSRFDGEVLTTYLVTSVAAGLLLLLFKRRRTQMLAAAGGMLYGAADVSIKAITGVANHDGIAAAATSPWLIAAALTTIGAFFCFQRALQSGRPMPVIALMTAGNNVVSILGGLMVFGDPLGRRPAMMLIHVLAFALIVFAAWLLAPAQAVVAADSESRGAGSSQSPAAPGAAAVHDRLNGEADRAYEQHQERDDRGDGDAGREHQHRRGQGDGDQQIDAEHRATHSGSLRYTARGRWRSTVKT